jgi:hypothetical protein
VVPLPVEGVEGVDGVEDVEGVVAGIEGVAPVSSTFLPQAPSASKAAKAIAVAAAGLNLDACMSVSFYENVKVNRSIAGNWLNASQSSIYPRLAGMPHETASHRAVGVFR